MSVDLTSGLWWPGKESGSPAPPVPYWPGTTEEGVPPYPGAPAEAFVQTPPSPPPGMTVDEPIPSVPSTGGGGGGGFYDSSATWLAMTNPFFRVTRRVRATRLTRFLESEARLGLKAMANWWTTGSRYGGLGEEIAASQAGQVFPWRAVFARLGVVAATLGLAFPNKLNEAPFWGGMFGPNFRGEVPSDAFPLSMAQLSANRDRVRQLVYEQKYGLANAGKPGSMLKKPPTPVFRGPDVTLGERPPTLVEMGQRVLHGDLFQELNPVGRLLNPPGWVPGSRDFSPGRSVITQSAPGVNDSRPDIFLPRSAGPEQSVPTAPRSTPSSPTSSPTSSPRTRVGGGAFPWGVVAFGAGAFLTVNLLARSHRGGGTPSFALPTAAPSAPSATIVTPPAMSVSPQVAIYGGGGFGAGGYCTPLPRGPRRKCLERAPVNWRSGRNKGKAAGTKCVRYAQRAS